MPVIHSIVQSFQSITSHEFMYMYNCLLDHISASYKVHYLVTILLHYTKIVYEWILKLMIKNFILKQSSET